MIGNPLVMNALPWIYWTACTSGRNARIRSHRWSAGQVGNLVGWFRWRARQWAVSILHVIWHKMESTSVGKGGRGSRRRWKILGWDADGRTRSMLWKSIYGTSWNRAGADIFNLIRLLFCSFLLPTYFSARRRHCTSGRSLRSWVTTAGLFLSQVRREAMTTTSTFSYSTRYMDASQAATSQLSEGKQTLSSVHNTFRRIWDRIQMTQLLKPTVIVVFHLTLKYFHFICNRHRISHANVFLFDTKT